MLKRIVLPVIAVLALTLLIAACGGNGDDDGDGEEPAVSFAESCQKTDEKQFAAAPELIIDTSKTYIAPIRPENGDIVL